MPGSETLYACWRADANLAIVTAATLASFSRTAPQGDLVPIAIAIAAGVGCVAGIVAFGVVFLVLLFWFRDDLVAE